ncbi:MAG: TatD family hydrolase [Planctomycetota bacterium]
MDLFDTHCHLTDVQFDADREATLTRAAAEGVRALVTIGTGTADLRKALGLAEAQAPGVRIAVAGGLTPYDIPNASSDDLAELRELLDGGDRVVAVGEIGLDRHHAYGPPEREEDFFIRQVEMALVLRKPVILHCRKAHERMRAILRDYAGHLKGGAVVHCFSGTYADAADYLDMGFKLSFTCTLTYKNAGAQRDVIGRVPLRSLMTETDAPYLAPEGARGTRNEPARVGAVVAAVAELQHQPPDRTAAALFGNAVEFFGWGA